MSAGPTAGRIGVEDHLDALDLAEPAIIEIAEPSTPPEQLGTSSPQTPRTSSPHPLEAHVQQLEEYEIERPPFYNRSTLAPDLIFSAESLRHDARALARILVSFLAYAIRTHGTTNTCVIGMYDRFEMWPNRPIEANSVATTVLNEKNIIYAKALRYTSRDMEERGLYIRRFAVKTDKRKKVMSAEWSIQMSPIVPTNNGYLQDQHSQQRDSGYRSLSSHHASPLPSANDLVRIHEANHSGSPRASRTNSMPVIDRGQMAPGRLGRLHSLAIDSRRYSQREEDDEFSGLGGKCYIM